MKWFTKIQACLGMICLVICFFNGSAYGGETIDVVLAKGKISAKTANVAHGDFLNICSRDEAFHQPYSIVSPNKFGSAKAREKDILAKNQCRIVEIKNTEKQPVEMTIYDRFMPSAYLELKVAPKPSSSPAPKVAEKAPEEKATTQAKGKDSARSQQEKPQDPNTFYEPKLEKKRLAFCYAPEDGCGEKAASAWCRTKGFKGAKKWEKEPPETARSKVGIYIGSDLSCKKGDCDIFSWITCRTGPPTFF